jgi:hypothetical protein
MGFKAELKELFIYKAPFDNGLTEHELDHVMIGYYNEDPVINPEEVKIGSGWESMLLKLMISFPKSIQFGSGYFLMSFTISLKIIKFRYFHNFFYKKMSTMRVTISRKAHFNAAHRLYRKDWTLKERSYFW